MLDTKKLKLAMNKFYNFNTENTQDRVNGAFPVERLVIEYMNHYGVPYKGVLLRGWKKTTRKDDIKNKRDAYTEYNGQTIYAQIKFRQPKPDGSPANYGSDISYVLIQPYTSLEDIRHTYRYEPEKMNFYSARDRKFDGMIYACMLDEGMVVSFAPYQETIKSLGRKVLEDWLENGYDLERGKPFQSNGCELRFKLDAGRGGWDKEIRKIILYIPPSVIASHPSAVCHTIDFGPPDWFLEELGIK